MNRLRNLWLPLLCVLAGVISLWLGWDGKIHPLNDGPYDSLRYLGMAETILHGDWLGSYNYLTLIRQPVYPLFVAFNGLFGFPLHITQQIAYLGALTLLILALRNCGMTKWKVGLFFFILAFHPIAFYPHMFVVTEAFYTTATIGVMAGCIGLWGTLEQHDPWRFWFWLGVLSVSLSLFWHMRGESIWILPALVGFYGFYAFKVFRAVVPLHARLKWLRFTCVVMFPILITIATGMAFMAMNKSHYGMGLVYEMTEPTFAETSELLAHIEAGPRIARVPVSHAALEAAYSVSPAMSRLKHYLDQQTDGRGWTQGGCQMLGICNELIGGWSMWALRNAANSLGVYRSAETARAFYAQIVSELHAACEEGLISCSSNPTGNLLYPPLTLKDIPFIFLSLLNIGYKFITLGELDQALNGTSHLTTTPEVITHYASITHDQGGKAANELFPSIGAHFFIFRILQIIGSLFLTYFVGHYFLQLIRNHRLVIARHSSNGTFIALFLVLLILSRLGLFAIIDAVSWPAIIRYLLAIYPAYLLLCVLALPGESKLVK